MPSNGYSTIGLKPSIVTRLQRATDEYFPGMFIPSTLIIMMNEIKRGYYSVGLHNVRPDFSGQYTSLTIRSDVKSWLQKTTQSCKKNMIRNMEQIVLPDLLACLS